MLPSSTSDPSGLIWKLEIVADAVLTANRNRPSWLISTQHGAVWPLENAGPTAVRTPPLSTLNAETVPFPGPAWALLTYS